FRVMASRVISRLSPKNSALFVCDLQERFSLRDAREFFPGITQTAKRMVDAAKILQMPIIVTEQYPKGLGHTIPDLGLQDIEKFEKTKFSMCLPELDGALKNSENIILVGIEAHVCVLQTTLDLLERGKNVHVVVDAVSSRSLPDRKYAFKQMDRAGAVLTTSECVLLGLLRDASHPKFKEIQKLILDPAPDVGLISKM
uniref:Isochorismatase domain-containing protein 1 n=1 Tax=Haemonchus contortus TaxID=6289 RepID=A0A7I4YLT7_HAECO